MDREGLNKATAVNAEADTSCFKVINIATYWYILVGQPEVWGRAYRALTKSGP